MLKKVISMALLAAMSVSMLSGCGRSKTAGSDGEISVSIYDRGQVPAEEGSYTNNRWTRYIDEQSGVKVNWVPIPRNEYKQKFNMLVASGEAPDLIVDYDIAMIRNFVQQGVLQPVDDFIESYSTEYKEYLKKHPELKQYTTYDGKMYAITSKRSIDGVINHGVWIRQDWLDKLGLSMPTTDAELLEVARAFQDGDPDGNGVDDTVPMAISNWHEIFPSMYQASNLWYVEDGKVKYGHTLDRYGESLRFLKNAYDENLIDSEFITDKDGTRQKQLWVTGKAGIFTKSWSETDNRELLQNNPEAEPVPMPPVATKYGTNAFWQEEDPYFYVAFNKNMKNPEAAMKLIDWMISDGWKPIKFGIEGEHYRDVNGVPQVIDQDKQKNEVAYAFEYAFVTQWDMKPEWTAAMAAEEDLGEAAGKEHGGQFQHEIPA